MYSIKNAIDHGIGKLGFQEIKENQRQVVEAYLARRDVLMVSPTGSGKSLTFHIAPFVLDYLKSGEQETINSVCLVIVPLLSLMRDQVTALQRKGIAAVCLGADTTPDEMSGIKDGKYNLLFGTPESILRSNRNLFRGALKERIDVVFVDESHCVAKWGQDSELEEAFRAEYGRLSELRSILRREVPFVALTATATDAVRKIIVKDLCMINCVELLTIPDKPHTKFSVETTDVGDLYSTFSWLIDELEVKQQNTSKVLVFCRKRAHVRDLYELFQEHLGEKAYVCPNGTEPKDDRTRLFAMYHRRTHKLVKETVEKEFCKADGTVRVVFCTVAFGMGVDVKGAQLVIHLGPSSALDDYLQECGRVGRDTTHLSHAVLLRYKGCTGSKNISKSMREYVKNTEDCRRVILMQEFSSSAKKGDIGHACCDICSKNCKCCCLNPDCHCPHQCTCKAEEFISPIACHLVNTNIAECSSIDHQVKKPVSRESSIKIRDQLLEYRAKLASNVPHEKLLTGLDLAAGYSRALIDRILLSVHLINSFEDLQKKFHFLSDEHAYHTWEVITAAVGDCDAEEDDIRSTASSCSYSDEGNEEESDFNTDINTESDDSDYVRHRVKRVLLESSSDDD